MRVKINNSLRQVIMILILSLCCMQFHAQDTINSLTNKDSIIEAANAVSSVKGESLEKTIVYNLGNTLYGRLAGLNMTQGNSEPGNDFPTMLIRGMNTFGSGAGNAPLYIIDGFITNNYGATNAFMQLVAEEVEEVTILKDAAAAAIYGMRGANGVVLVKTKKGTKGGLKVNVSTKQGFSQPQYLPKILHAYDYAKLYTEAQLNDSVTTLRYTPIDLEAYRKGNDPYFHPNVNWYEQVLRKSAPLSTYNINMKGGNNFVRFFAMANFLQSQGLFKKFGDLDEESANSKYERLNFRSNIDLNITKRLSALFMVGGSVEERNNPGSYYASSTFGLLATLPSNAFPVKNPDGSWGGNNIFANPYANLLATGFYKTNARTILSSLRVTEDLGFITEGLKISAGVSINNYFMSGSAKSKTYARYMLSTTGRGDTIYSSAIGNKTNLSGSETTLDQYRNFIISGNLDYERSFGKHYLISQASVSTDNVTIFGPSNDQSVPTTTSIDPFKHNNGHLRINYSYDEKYLAQLVGAYTGSSMFPPGKNYGFFPAASVGWVISKENFLNDNNFINLLKLRASYGILGNNVTHTLGSRRYLWESVYSSRDYFFGEGNNIFYSNYEQQFANPNFTWERDKQLNVGLDIGILKNLSLSVNVFNKKRSNILVPASGSVPSFMGLNTIPGLSVGKASNSGFDFDISYANPSQKRFRFTVDANVGYNKTKIIYTAEPIQINNLLYAVGNEIGYTMGYHAIGFYTKEDIEKIKADPKSVPSVLSEVIRPGDIKYQDLGGPEGRPDGVINSYDQRPIGTPWQPRVYGGLHSALFYKGFDLDIVFQGVTSVSRRLGDNFYAFQSNRLATEIALGRWTPETANTATYPRLSSKDNLNNYLVSDFWIRNGSFIKLRSAELGYTFSGFKDRLKLDAIRIYVVGSNLFSLDKIPYGDPESLAGHPVLRSVAAGLRIQL